jgi:ATP-dependent DNA helicase RecG
MMAGQRSPRNPLIMEILRDYGYVDARGMGIRTKVIPLMKSQNNAVPVFEAADDYLKTILPGKQKGESGTGEHYPPAPAEKQNFKERKNDSKG